MYSKSVVVAWTTCNDILLRDLLLVLLLVIITSGCHNNVAKKIFDTSSHPLQKQVAFILNDLRDFFNKYYENTIKFWKYLSKCK